MNQNKIIENFSEIIWVILPVYKKSIVIEESNIITKRYKSELKKSYTWWLKHLGTLLPPHASEAAMKVARKHNIDLFALQWKDQKKAEKKMGLKEGEKFFYHEHEIPIEDLFRKILKAESKEKIVKLIKDSSVVWITREEEIPLKSFGREKDAYQKAGIIRRNNPYKSKWMEMGWDIDQRTK